MPFDREKFLAKHGSFSQAREDRYEEAVVKHLLKRSDSLGLLGQIAEYSRRELGMEGLYLAGLNVAAAFPLWLTSAKVAGLDDSAWLRLMTKPNRHPLIARYAEKQVDFPEQTRAKQLAMVFPWPGWHKFVLLHQWDSAGAGETPKYVWYGGSDKQIHVIETLDNFLQSHNLYKQREADDKEYLEALDAQEQQ